MHLLTRMESYLTITTTTITTTTTTITTTKTRLGQGYLHPNKVAIETLVMPRLLLLLLEMRSLY